MSREQTPNPTSAPTTAIWYRCVCGTAVSLDVATGGNCPHCGRRYAAAVLRNVSGETLVVDDRSPEIVTADLVDERDPLIGRRLQHYRIESRLGSGGMGSVYRALDESLQRYVAVKVLRPRKRGGPSDSAHVERLLQEAIAQARVNHPNIVHIYYVGRVDDLPFFAMEIVHGATLAQRLSQGPISFAQVIHFGEQIAGALRNAADYDIVHGDIKPANMLLVDEQTVKLSDFGLSRRLSQSDESSSYVAGTPNYLAPESLHGTPPDVRSDLYSLGVTLYEMTFGRLPYEISGSRLDELMRAHQAAELRFPEPWPGDVPKAWRAVLERLLQKSPEARYANYQELLADLQRLRPVNRPAANRLPRALAWVFDLVLAVIVQALFLVPLAGLVVGADIVGTLPVLRFILLMFVISVPLFLAWLQSVWGTSPGKNLFQLRIVDRHGLKPTANIMGLRALAQFLPIVETSLTMLLTEVGLSPLARVVSGVTGVFLLADILFAMFRSNGNSLHDQLCDTRVVLDD